MSPDPPSNPLPLAVDDEMKDEEYVEEGVGENMVVVVTSRDKETILDVPSMDSVLLSSMNGEEVIIIDSSNNVGVMT